jgi:hypothetical protein
MKYKNIITEYQGIKFHSKKEAKRYGDLLLLQKMNYIKDLVIQPKIPLIVNNKTIGSYIGDFKYFDNKLKKTVIEDVKSKATITPLYRLKKKILATYQPPVEITEIF